MSYVIAYITVYDLFAAAANSCTMGSGSLACCRPALSQVQLFARFEFGSVVLLAPGMMMLGCSQKDGWYTWKFEDASHDARPCCYGLIGILCMQHGIHNHVETWSMMVR